jgi:glycosyltransferase involved in cell wall biosynthesis
VGSPGATLDKVLVVNTTDEGGGAERMAMTVLDGFRSLGTETWLAVGRKFTDHPHVVALDRGSGMPLGRRMAREARRTATRALGVEDFDYPASRRLPHVAGSAPDLVLCFNLHGDYFDLRALPGLSRRLPVVLALADSWLFTGHCASPLGCPRWETGCGACPDLTIPPAVERDATWLNWRRKRRILSSARLFAASPSHWLLERAERSLLASALDGARVIPNGIDLDIFTPTGVVDDREALGIHPDALLVLFVCNLGAASPFRDFQTVREALAELARAGVERPVELLVVGGEAELERLSDRVRIRHLPYRRSPAELAALYRAADLCVHAAAEEAFCLVAAEAMACGVPVAAAASGGIEEVVDHGRTGLLVPPGRADALADAVRSLLTDAGRRERMGAAASEAARSRFDDRRMVRDLHEWCREAADAFRAKRAA